MSPPWMPLYVSDYLGDTGHLSTLEHGAYMLLIMHYWQTGALPDDDRKLSRIARMTGEQWADVRDTMADMFGPRWTHKRIDAELAHAEQVISKRSVAAKAMHAKRNASSQHEQCTISANAHAYAEQMHMQSSIPSQPQPPSPRSDADASDARGCPSELPPPLPVQPSDGGMTPPAPNRSDQQAFERFWQAYPHKVGKQDAARAFAVVMKRGAVSLDAMLAALDRYIRDKPPDRAWCNPATWLRQGRWDDEPGPDPVSRGPTPPAPPSPSGASQRIAAMVGEVHQLDEQRLPSHDP